MRRGKKYQPEVLQRTIFDVRAHRCYRRSIPLPYLVRRSSLSIDVDAGTLKSRSKSQIRNGKSAFIQQ